MEKTITIEFSGDPEYLRQIELRFKQIALKKMEEAQSMKEALDIWNKFKRFHRDRDFFNAKELTKKRLS